MDKPRPSDNVTDHTTLNGSNPTVRIPAEWEPHAATWMQWPRDAEASLRRNFSAIIANWVCQKDRNPGLSRVEMERRFERAFGVTQIVWLLSASSDDIIKGHVDGIARFIDKDTVAVARYLDQSDPDAPVYEEAASIIQNAGFEVVRVDMPGYVSYHGHPLPANYMNWLVANGAVILPGFGAPAWDDAARAMIEGFFPGRNVIVVEILDIWDQGGGVHCVTNDQPQVSRLDI